VRDIRVDRVPDRAGRKLDAKEFRYSDQQPQEYAVGFPGNLYDREDR